MAEERSDVWNVLPIFEYCLLFGFVVPLQLKDYQLIFDEGMKNIFKDFFSQCARPEGFLGRCMLRFMNFGHAPLTNWGLGQVAFREETVVCNHQRNTELKSLRGLVAKSSSTFVAHPSAVDNQ